MFTHPFHVFDNHNAFLSEGGALAVVVRDFSETPHGTRGGTDFPRPMRKSEARRRLACPPLARRDGAPHERGAGGGSDPPFLTARAAPGGVSRFSTVNPPLGGSLLPAGRLKCKTWTRIVLLNLALIAAGLRPGSHPGLPREDALPDLVGATDPLGQVTRPLPIKTRRRSNRSERA